MFDVVLVLASAKLSSVVPVTEADGPHMRKLMSSGEQGSGKKPQEQTTYLLLRCLWKYHANRSLS